MKKFLNFLSKHIAIIVLIVLLLGLFYFLSLETLKNQNSENDFEFSKITGTYYIENNFLDSSILNYLCASSDTAPNYSITLDDENKIRYAFAYTKNQTNASEIAFPDFLNNYYMLFNENINENIFIEAVAIEGYMYDKTEEKFIPDSTSNTELPIITNLLKDCKLVTSNFEKVKIDNTNVVYNLNSDIIKENLDLPVPMEENEEEVVGTLNISFQLIDNHLVIKDFHIDFNESL